MKYGLSETGVARREAGLEAALQAVKLRGRRWRAVQSVCAGAAALLLVVAGVWAAFPVHRSTVVVDVADANTANTGSSIQPSTGSGGGGKVGATLVAIEGIEVVHTVPLANHFERLDDEGLQRALREAGESGGIVRIGNNVIVEGLQVAGK